MTRDILAQAADIARSCAMPTSIDWTQEPANELEREIRAKIIERMELTSDPWYNLSRLPARGLGDCPYAASDLEAALDRATCKAHDKARRDHAAKTQQLISEAFADPDALPPLDGLDAATQCFESVLLRARLEKAHEGIQKLRHLAGEAAKAPGAQADADDALTFEQCVAVLRALARIPHRDAFDSLLGAIWARVSKRMRALDAERAHREIAKARMCRPLKGDGGAL